jgi:TonB family protein
VLESTPQPTRRSRSCIAVSLLVHAVLVAVLAEVRPAAAPTPPSRGELTKLTWEPAARITFPSPPRPPRPTPAADPIERAARMPAPPTWRPPAPRDPSVWLGAPHIEPQPSPAPLIPESLDTKLAPPVEARRVAPAAPPGTAFAQVRRTLEAEKPALTAPAESVFAAVAQATADSSADRAPLASVGFGSASGYAPDAKPTTVTAAHGVFGGVSADWAASGSLTPMVETSFEAVSARRAPAPTKRDLEPERVDLEPVRILDKPDPVYTADARALRLEGDVTVEALFRADGRIEGVRVVKGLGHGLDEAAVTAVKAIRYEPARRAGVAEDARLRLVVRFQLAY